MSALERKNIDDLTALELAAYEHAIGVLLDDPDPITNYQHHADFHNIFGNNPPRGCEHRNDLFLPWHRYHLLNFERALQLSDPDHPTLSTRNVTIPYWDWTVHPRTGQRFPSAFEDPASRLFNEERNAEQAEPMFSAEYMTGVIREHSDWNVFAGGLKNQNEFFGALESPSHNDMHSAYIGGLMGDPGSAAEDPIYWSFHAFIDRVWERWRRIHQKRPTCLECTLRGFTLAPRTADVELTGATLALDGGAVSLGYFYAFAPEEVVPVPQPHTLTAAARFEAMMSDPQADVEQVLRLEPADQPLTFKLPALDRPPNRATLWLIQLTPPVARSVRLAAFVHPAGTPITVEAAESQRSYHVGDFSFWRAHHLADGQTAGAVLNVTRAFRRHAEAGTPLLLTLVPLVMAEDPAGGHQHGAGGHPPPGDGVGVGITLQGVALQLDGDGVPDILLGVVPPHGR